MGKKYLVEEVETYDFDNSRFCSYIIAGVIVLWLNIWVLKSIFHGFVNMDLVVTRDAEMLGILIGIFMSWIVGLVFFVKHIHRGFIETLKFVFEKIFFLSITFMTFFSMFVPYICRVVFYNEWSIDFFHVFISLIFNIIVFTLCSFVITIIGTLIVTFVGVVISYLFYSVVYRIKSINIKKTMCYDKIERFCRTKKFREKVFMFKLFPNKIEFIDVNGFVLKCISFSELGYSNLSLLSQFSLVSLIRRSSLVKLFIDQVFFDDEDICVITVVNSELYKTVKKIRNFVLIERVKLYFREKFIQRKIRNERRRKYKEAVRSGKDW